jgi:hypothetical protein
VWRKPAALEGRLLGGTIGRPGVNQKQHVQLF